MRYFGTLRAASLFTLLPIALFVVILKIALAQEVISGEEAIPSEAVLEVGRGTAFTIPETVETIIVVDNSIADVKSPTPGRMLLFGKAVGDTEVYAIDFEGRIVFERSVKVKHQGTTIESALEQRFPDSDVAVSSSAGSIMITGSADTPRDAKDILETVKPFAPDDTIINRLDVKSARRVRLYVRLVEIQRNIDDSFGIDWSAILATGSIALNVFQGAQFIAPALAAVGGGASSSFSAGDVDVNLAVDWLEQRGYASILSEPNLTTMSGEPARFAVGQSIPLPTFTAAEADNVATGNFGVTYGFFGLELEFTPVVQSRSSVRLDIDISSSDVTNDVIVINQNRLPVFNSEDFKTVIELMPGQTFAIAGLMKKVGRDTVDRAPILGSLPVLGQLFSSTRYQQGQSDLVVLVTPYFLDGEVDGLLEQAATNRPLTNIEHILLTRKTGEAPLVAPSGTPRMPRDVGFIY